MTKHEALLSVEGLTIGVQGHPKRPPLVSNVSFTVGSHRVLGLIGESGSGKSLTSRAILGLLPRGLHIQGGTIRYHDVEVTHWHRQQTVQRGRDIGIIFQNPMSALNPVLTIGEQLIEGVQHHQRLGKRAARQLAIDFLAQVGLGDAASRVMDGYPHRLSGGMLQRVMIAMALLPQPKLLIADEPTTALDVTTQYHILELLAELKQTLGLTMLFISHDLHVVSNFCNEVVVLRHGQVIEKGPTAAVFAAPAQAYTKELLAASTLRESSPKGEHDVQFG